MKFYRHLYGGGMNLPPTIQMHKLCRAKPSLVFDKAHSDLANTLLILGSSFQLQIFANWSQSKVSKNNKQTNKCRKVYSMNFSNIPCLCYWTLACGLRNFINFLHFSFWSKILFIILPRSNFIVSWLIFFLRCVIFGIYYSLRVTEFLNF